MTQLKWSPDASDPPGVERDAHEVIVLAPRRERNLERRRRHIERRTRIEPEVYAAHCGSRLRALCDPATLVKGALWITGFRGWMARNALALRRRRLAFAFDDLPEAFHRFSLLHLTDLHIDAHPDLADRVIEQISRVEVDLCVMTGDYRLGMARGPHNAYRWYMKKVIDRIRSRGGVIGILGNHDAAEDVGALEDMGVRMLLNEAVEVRKGGESLWISGVDDPHDYRCHDLTEALRSVPDSAFRILLAHTPEIYQEAAGADCRLYLCGHTHGGQLRLPGLGPLITKARCPRAYTHGVWRHGRMHGYTGNGIGTSGTFARMSCPPEVGLIELWKTGLERHNGRQTPERL